MDKGGTNQYKKIVSVFSIPKNVSSSCAILSNFVLRFLLVLIASSIRILLVGHFFHFLLLKTLNRVNYSIQNMNIQLISVVSKLLTSKIERFEKIVNDF